MFDWHDLAWRSIDKKHSKIEDRVPRIDQLFDQIVEWRQQQQQRQQQRDYVDKSMFYQTFSNA